MRRSGCEVNSSTDTHGQVLQYEELRMRTARASSLRPATLVFIFTCLLLSKAAVSTSARQSPNHPTTGPQTRTTPSQFRASAATSARTLKPLVMGTRGVVAAGTPLVAEAGLRILEKGGNAIDAGVATVFAAGVVEQI